MSPSGWLLLVLAMLSGCDDVGDDDRCGPVEPADQRHTVLIDAGEETDVGPCEHVCGIIPGKSSCRYVTSVDDAGKPVLAAERTQTVICD